MRLPNITGLMLFACLFLPGFAPDAQAQRSGQSTTIRAGTVTGVQHIDLKDGNAAAGALVGGAFGAAIGGSSSSRKRNQSAALGAIIGSAAARNQRTPGRRYTVTLIDGSTVQVATEQMGMQMGDCVFIEESMGGRNNRSRTNIRRAPVTACELESQPILKDRDVEAELQGDAALCFNARQQLAESDDDDDAAFDRAVRRVKLLCYD
ncbi:MAG: hypothetical protein ACR2Q3_04055 [Woeseiaceae bacterium]